MSRTLAQAQADLFAALNDILKADDDFGDYESYLNDFYDDPAEREQARLRLTKAEKVVSNPISSNQKPSAIQALKEMLWDLCDSEQCNTKRQQLFAQAGLFTDPRSWKPSYHNSLEDAGL